MKITEKEFIEKVCKIAGCILPYGKACHVFSINCPVMKVLEEFDIKIEQPKEDHEIDFEKAFDKKYTTLEQKFALESAYQKLLSKYNELKDKK